MYVYVFTSVYSPQLFIIKTETGVCTISSPGSHRSSGGRVGGKGLFTRHHGGHADKPR